MARANAGKIGNVVYGKTYRDLSTLWVTPSPTLQLDAQIVFASWMALALPMNTRVKPIAIGNAEVGEAYELAADIAVKENWKYLLTLEHDNLPPRDGLLRLYEGIQAYDAVGGLYWCKGETGAAMIYGDTALPGDFTPLSPLKDRLQPCNGMGMGFTLFNVEMFRKIPKPWFKTVDGVDEKVTQDLFFFKKAAQYGFKFAVDTRVKVGHMDLSTRQIW